MAGAVRAEARVIMATREASLGASACHLKRHHERHLTSRGYCSPYSWHTAVSAATERGNTVTDQQHQESSEDFGGTVGKGKAAGWNLGEHRTRRADRAVGHDCRNTCVVQLCLQYDTRQEYNSERNGHAMPHTTETAKRTARAAYRAAVRAADVRETSYRYNK